MRKDITPDMLNYNKFPGPKFVHFDNQVRSEGIELELVDNDKEGWRIFSSAFPIFSSNMTISLGIGPAMNYACGVSTRTSGS